MKLSDFNKMFGSGKIKRGTDAGSVFQTETEKQQKTKRTNVGEKNGKVFILLIIVSVSFCIYVFKLFSMQVLEGEDHRRDAVTISSRSKEIPARRGEIFDRNYEDTALRASLVTNTDAFAVDIIPGEIPQGKYDSVVSRLAEYLVIHKSVIDDKIPPSLRRSFTAIEIKSNVEFKIIENIAENIVDLPGVSWRSKPLRNYTGADSLSHVLGYVGNITNDELKIMYNQNYRNTSIVGKIGIEKQYDSILQGTPGLESRTVDARGRLISVNAPTPPKPGNNLVLTIDARIQSLAERALGNRVGAAVVLKPSNGEILAMVSYPYFDANSMSGDIVSQIYTALSDDNKKPLLNRAINAVYPPASTFKVVMSTALLQEKSISEDTKFNCTGTITYGNRVFHCHIGIPGHGWLDLRNGLAQSCNIYFWTIGAMGENGNGRNALSVDRIAKYANEFGYGRELNIDLPNSSEGFIPTAEWKERRYHEKWLGGDTMSMSIGQGYTLVTPLHVANMMAMVANGGVIYKPHILKETRDPVSEEIISETKPEILFDARSSISEQTWKQMQSNLRYAVSNGSAQYPLQNRLVQIAGKTGTAEVAQYVNQWHSWFVAYAPFDALPEDAVVVCVLVEAVNPWEWWAPYAANIIFQGIFSKTYDYDQAIDSLGFRYLLKPAGRRE